MERVNEAVGEGDGKVSCVPKVDHRAIAYYD